MKWTYRPALDGLRSMAALVIILFHAGVEWVPGGFVPLDLFFVLSGYLVTNVILSEIDRKGKLDLGRFYARRVRRLLPAAILTIVGVTLIFLLLTSVVRRLEVIGDAQAALLYYANWHHIMQSTDYFAAEQVSPFLHFWSLSLEEQFYIFFPLLVIFLLKLKSKWALPVGLTVVFLASLASQVYWGRVDEMHAYYGTDARLYQIVAGALLAVAMRSPRFQVSRRWGTVIAVTGFATWVLLIGPWLDLTQSNRGIVAMVACTMLVGGLMINDQQLLSRAVSARIPVYLGTITYAIYLWHWPITLVLQEFIATSPETLAVLVGVLSVAMAAASAELLETPVRTSKLLDGHKWKVVVAGVGTSALIAVFFVPWALEKDRQPSLVANGGANQTTSVQGVAAETAAAEAEDVPSGIDWAAIQADKGADLPCEAEDPTECIVVEGDGPHVLLVGDSHARMLAPMFREIAEEQGWTFSMNVLAGCMWQPDIVNLQSPQARIERCEGIRVGWYDEKLPQLDPDVIVLVSQDRLASKAKMRNLEARDDVREPIERTILRSTRETLDTITQHVDHVVLIEDVLTPDTFRPDECLATATTAVDCVVPLPVDTPGTSAAYITMAQVLDNVSTVNLNNAFCPSAPTCQPVVNGEVVWRDRYHVATDFAVARREEVWKALEGTGAFS
ncbi:acyltransferase family protein [Nocardioides massiliensis]|uniref:Peptidoglycan/LPS O-acetylase OafA/YrhL n=1 Tax=Nocardioides massiliensis TaxID=1325935 RepID=A0ABT9NIP7_9ACTN|nr:acyltransferase family protein [Nocardioides massiliensis]MDP9820294.1 peptidoglycan/LPS O-acetylase OafA/YrhL [Nocardioides massiliensis]